MDDSQSSLLSKIGPTFSFSNVVWIIALWIGYRVCVALYNISPFHPLSSFPGPKIAAASYLYEAYYDWLCVGRYGHVIKSMHDAYGPIVRSGSAHRCPTESNTENVLPESTPTNYTALTHPLPTKSTPVPVVSATNGNTNLTLAALHPSPSRPSAP